MFCDPFFEELLPFFEIFFQDLFNHILPDALFKDILIVQCNVGYNNTRKPSCLFPVLHIRRRLYELFFVELLGIAGFHLGRG